MSVYNLTVVVEKGEDGNFLAICPALQGCYAEGKTRKDALRMIRDAIRLHVDARAEKDNSIRRGVFLSRSGSKKRILAGIMRSAKQVSLHKKRLLELKTLQQVLDAI